MTAICEMNCYKVVTGYRSGCADPWCATVSMVKRDGTECSGSGFGHSERDAIADAFHAFLAVAGRLGYLARPGDSP